GSLWLGCVCMYAIISNTRAGGSWCKVLVYGSTASEGRASSTLMTASIQFYTRTEVAVNIPYDIFSNRGRTTCFLLLCMKYSKFVNFQQTFDIVYIRKYAQGPSSPSFFQFVSNAPNFTHTQRSK